MNLEAIQKALCQCKYDCWVFYDFRHSDDLAYQVLGLDPNLHATRRWYYIIPAKGQPLKVVHRIESENLACLPGRQREYVQWQELESLLRSELSGFKRIAMQYSPNNNNPYISKVDAGTLEFIRSCGVEVVSSGDLITQFQAVLTAAQLHSHERAALVISNLIDETFLEIKRRLSSGEACSEFLIQQFMVKRYEEEGLVSDCPPIVAVAPNNANPHYLPNAQKSSDIKQGDFFLIDTWAKCGEQGIYYDVTWLAYVGRTVPEKIQNVFDTVIASRDSAFTYINDNWAKKQPVHGCDVDDAARRVIENAGYGRYVKHRTGHSIHTTTHGSGAHLDNLETHDERKILPGTLFSIEPGIYIDGEFGMRSEINVFMEEDGPRSTGKPFQTNIVCIGV
jgi:Xaa-Pro dipeptidase